MLSKSLSYVRDSENVVTTVILGGLLVLLGVLIVPTVTLVGYLMRVLRSSADDEDVAPEIRTGDLVDLTVEGIPGAVVGFVYFLIPTLVAAVFVGGSIVALVAGGSANSGGLLGLGFGGILIGGLLATVLGLVAAYVVPAALANVAESGSIGAGFDLGTLRPVLFSGAYATAWAMGVGLLLVAGLLVGVISTVTFGLGGILGAFVQFPALVAAYYIVGRTWGDLNTDRVYDDADPTEQAAI
jgi:hypothetical protein